MAVASPDVENDALESCQRKFRNFVPPPGEIFCNWTWDSVLCWPPTKAATTAIQNCPKDRGVDPTKLVYKNCSASGRWEGRTKGNYDSPQGWTNYTSCFTPETWELFKMLYAGSEDNAKIKLEIAEKTRTLEIVGFSVSLIALLFSLAIFFRFRGLRNSRTRIHKNLFIAMEIQVVVRLTLYIDQVIVREKMNFWQGIHNTNFIIEKIALLLLDILIMFAITMANAEVQVPEKVVDSAAVTLDMKPVLCETSYVLLEYARTAMFMWMFVEGLYLHNMITVTVFHQEQSYYAVYSVIGWASPVAITTAWALVTALHYKASKCWWGYNLTVYFWILEGPRLAVVLLNFLFLLNIIRVLVVKLRQSRKSEIEQVRKAVRAAIVLVPLLGITNLISMSKSPLEKSVWEFALWSYGTHFLTSFQGFFIAFLYCFLNGERGGGINFLPQKKAFYAALVWNMAIVIGNTMDPQGGPFAGSRGYFFAKKTALMQVRATVMKSISTYFSLRKHQKKVTTNSFFCGIFATSPESPVNQEVNANSQICSARLQRRQSRCEKWKEITENQWTRKTDHVELIVPVIETRV